MNPPKPEAPAPESNIAKLIDSFGGPVAVSRCLGGVPAYQEVARWKKRGWAAPKHVLALRDEGLIPQGMTIEDLLQDRKAAKDREAAAENAKAIKRGGLV